MSYRHPRFYREDYTGFNKAMSSAFQTQFKNQEEFWDKKIAARKEYETDLHAQADAMREEVKNMEGLTADQQKNQEAIVQKFINEGLKVEGLDKPGLFGGKIKETGKKSKLDLDSANASFNSEISALNAITDRTFVENLDIAESYDNGSQSYLEYANVVKGLKANFKNGGKMEMDYKGDNAFELGITIPNSRWTPETIDDGKGGTIPNPRWKKGINEGLEENLTYSANDIQRIIGENDPERRVQIEADITEAKTTLFNTAKSELEARAAYGGSKAGTEGGGRNLTQANLIYEQYKRIFDDTNTFINLSK